MLFQDFLLDCFFVTGVDFGIGEILGKPVYDVLGSAILFTVCVDGRDVDFHVGYGAGQVVYVDAGQ